MVEYKLVYENEDKTIKLTKKIEKEPSIFGVATLPPKTIQFELDKQTVTLTLVETQVYPK